MKIFSTRTLWLITPCIIVAQIVVLFLLGQPPICTCGYVKLWEGAVLTFGNSQHLTDWYTFSHIIHGVIFYAFFTVLFPKMSVPTKLLLSVGVEVGWEITENTPWIINKYREQAIAQGYMGDSILNSVSDTIAMVGGFFIARKLPILATIFVVIGFDLFVGYMIHDGLALNILNFVYPNDAVSAWQAQAL